MQSRFPITWAAVLGSDAVNQCLRALNPTLFDETVYPPSARWFRALELCSPERVRVVIVGQDPYHGPNQANGLAFAVDADIPHPPSLANLCREWQSDLGEPLPERVDLARWAARGVLLLNRVLTVRPGQAGSCRGMGWEALTEHIIRYVGRPGRHCVFCLWGRDAQQVRPWIHETHTVIASPHPSPLSAYRGFFGSRPFSRANAALIRHGQDPLDWSLSGDLSGD